MSAEPPRILELAWGRIVVEGLGEAKDVKLWPGGARAWDWRETGTRHRPGVQPADVEEIAAAGIGVLVVGCGMEGRLGVPVETIEWLEERGIRVEADRTEPAASRYGVLRAQGPVGGIFHTTC